jgi:hypothetical protein
MSAGRDRPSSGPSILLTLVISLLTTLVIGSMLYYTLKRHDVARAQDLDQAAGQALDQRAVAAGRALAAVGRFVMEADVGRMPELVEAALRSGDLVDMLIVNRDDVVLAAKNPAQVGQRLQDATWLSWKGQNREMAQRAVGQARQPVFVVVEPLTDKGDTLAWAMLVFGVPPATSSLREPMERMGEVARLMAPILLFLLISIGLSMKLATATIRKQIQGVMADVLDGADEVSEGEGRQPWLRKVS